MTLFITDLQVTKLLHVELVQHADLAQGDFFSGSYEWKVRWGGRLFSGTQPSLVPIQFCKIPQMSIKVQVDNVLEISV